jgi:hypothetical protein
MGSRMRTRRGQPQFIPIFRARLERISPPATLQAFAPFALAHSLLLSLPFSLSVAAIPSRRSIGLSASLSYHPFGSAVHCEIVWGEARRRGTPDFQSLLAQLEVSKSRRGNFVSQIAKRGPPRWQAGAGTSWIFQQEVFRILFAEGSARSRARSNSRALRKRLIVHASIAKRFPSMACESPVEIERIKQARARGLLYSAVPPSARSALSDTRETATSRLHRSVQGLNYQLSPFSQHSGTSLRRCASSLHAREPVVFLLSVGLHYRAIRRESEREMVFAKLSSAVEGNAGIPADLSRGVTFRDRTLRYLVAELGAPAELLPRPPRGGTSRGKVRRGEISLRRRLQAGSSRFERLFKCQEVMEGGKGIPSRRRAQFDV